MAGALLVPVVLASFGVPGLADGAANGGSTAGRGTPGALPPRLAAGLAQYALSDSQLARVRGGFSLPNGISFSFGFQQITKLGQMLVQSILVPEISDPGSHIPVYVVGGTVALRGGGSIGVQGGGTSAGVSAGAGSERAAFVSINGSRVSGPGTRGDNAVAVSDPTTNPGSGNTASPGGGGSPPGTEYSVPVSTAAITVSTTIGGTNGHGATSIQTTLGSNGVLSGISNSQSNEVITQVTQMSISVSGLAQSVAAAQAAESVSQSATQRLGMH
ncbi:MAG: hypothetical protein ACREFP_26570 [Acetobacteraceae bacterium]